MKHLPNILTTLRFFMAPLFAYVFWMDDTNGQNVFYAVTVYALAGVTDVVDGRIARRYNVMSTYGKLMDPMADKFMQLTVFTCLAMAYIVPVWVVIVLVIKELLMVLGGVLLYRKGVVVQSNRYGKISTSVFYAATIVIILFPQMPAHHKDIILGTALAFALVALAQYFHYFKSDIRK